jgi:hypothetical protein
VALAALAGCGSSSSTTTAPPATGTGGAPTIHSGFFSSPDGNIGCALDKSQARCDIRKRTWKPPPKPARCPPEVDYGQGIWVQGKQKAALVCAGDTALGAKKVLPVGEVSSIGTFQCTSEKTGMQCGNTATGHGFTLSSSGYRLF